MARRSLSSTAAAVLAVSVLVAPTTGAGGAAAARGDGGTQAAAGAGWGAPHVLANSFYFGNSDLGSRHDAAGSWLARVEVAGTGTTAVGYQRLRRPSGDGPERPAAAVRAPAGTWSDRVLAAPGRPGYTWVGTDRRGRVTVVWFSERRDRTGDRVVRWARRSAAGVWGTNRRLRGVDGRPTDFDVAPSGFGALSFVSHRDAFVKVLTPQGTWRPRAQVSGERLGRGVIGTAAVVSNTGRVTAAFWSITVDNRSGSSGPLQRGGLTAAGHRLPVVRLAHLDQNDPWSVVGSPRGSAAVQVGEDDVTFRLTGDRWREATMPVTAVAVGNAAVTVASLSPTGVSPQQYSLTDYTRGTGQWSGPRVVATLTAQEYAGGSPSAVDLVHDGATTLLGFSLWHTDTTPISYSSRVVTDRDGKVTVADLPGCLVDLDARDDRAAVLTTPACQPGGRLSVRTR